MRNDEILFVVNSYYALKSENAAPLPASVAWKRRLNMKDLIKASETIDEALKEVSEQYNDDEHSEAKDETRVVKPEYLSEFLEAKKEILLQDTDVVIRKIKIGELDGLSLSDEMLNTLEFMIEE